MTRDLKRWTIVIRCYACDQKFAFHDLPVERIVVVPQIAPCPHCSAKPIIASGLDSSEASKVHRILELTQGVAPTFRKEMGGDTWHFSDECSAWPTENYEQRKTAPGGELCNECKAKQASL